MYDFHMHSNFSSDTNVKMKDMVESAIKKGFKQITFTDHVDYEYNSPEISFDIDIDTYKEEINRYREHYGSQIRINLGLEVGIQPHILNRCRDLVERAEPDFVIASQHNIHKQDLYLGHYYENRTPEEALKLSFKELEEMVSAFDHFSVIGHIDIVKRYNKAVRMLPKQLFMDCAKPVLRLLIDKKKGIEVNTSGLRQGLEETLPSFEILKLYKEMGGTILTIGSDAHQPEDIGHSFKYVLTRLQHIGFEHIYTFCKMQPTPISIKDVLQELESIESQRA